MPNLNFYEHANFLQKVIAHHCQSVHYKILNRTPSHIDLRDKLMADNNALEANYKALIVKYGLSLEGKTGEDIKPTAAEMNALVKVYNIYKRELAEEKETFIQMGADKSVLDHIEKEFATHLTWLKDFSAYMRAFI